MVVEGFCHPPLSIIFSIDSPCSSKSSAAPSLKKCPLSGCSFGAKVNLSCSVFKIVLILAGLGHSL